jgi:ubiquinone/menaquinone biosynthesis C-methylase UbiE
MFVQPHTISRIAKGFDFLAPVYQTLTDSIFGKKLELSQLQFISCIKADDQVLVLGGGSGNLLKSLLHHQPRVIVDYIDISEKMIQLAREKTQNPSTVNFIAGTEQNIPDRKYTVVITNFYLDLFSDTALQSVIQKIKTHLTPDAQWLATDFVSDKSWHKILLRIMYRFFRIATGIEARSLPQWEKHIVQAGLTENQSKFFFGRFIKSCRYVNC